LAFRGAFVLAAIGVPPLVLIPRGSFLGVCGSFLDKRGYALL
jgi:hypothetical protein